MFMNTWEIDEAVDLFRTHPLLGPATRTLANLRDHADHNSDGWAYWPKPARAAKQLQELIHYTPDGVPWWDTDRVDVTKAQVRKAYTYRSRPSATQRRPAQHLHRGVAMTPYELARYIKRKRDELADGEEDDPEHLGPAVARGCLREGSGNGQ